METVLRYLESLGSDNQLDDGQLTRKLAMLLAITTASRASELQALHLNLMADKGHFISFTLSTPSKTCKPGRRRIITVNEYKPRPLLDPVACTRNYILRSQTWRDNAKRQKLLLGIVKPHNPVASSTISHWLKTIMEGAGIDTTIYQAHSTRSASTSKAKVGGLSVSDILERANWANAATFFRFYNREDSVNSCFTNSVLSSQL